MLDNESLQYPGWYKYLKLVVGWHLRLVYMVNSLLDEKLRHASFIYYQ